MHFNADFPAGCLTYDGPHSLKCYKSIWRNAGCLSKGFNSPENLTTYENDTLNGFNLR